MPLARFWKTMEDADLIREMSRGKDRAFRELVQRYQSPLYTYALRFSGVKEEAEDTVQETFLRLYANRHKLDASKSLKAYLFRICRNLLIDATRKKRFTGQEPSAQADPSPSPDERIHKKEWQAILMRAIETLPENQRTAILLRHTQELSYAEISEVMGLSVSAVESLLVRGRKSLKACLSKKASLSRRVAAGRNHS
ncbi:MAG: sigma-70 family RNA polymerase sigma factor [Desulfobacterales bacterium]|nr:sigma-70 family RNA polymerase sigma factor [Desulfobacterales bacterium]